MTIDQSKIGTCLQSTTMFRIPELIIFSVCLRSSSAALGRFWVPKVRVWAQSLIPYEIIAIVLLNSNQMIQILTQEHQPKRLHSRLAIDLEVLTQVGFHVGDHVTSRWLCRSSQRKPPIGIVDWGRWLHGLLTLLGQRAADMVEPPIA